MMDSQMKKILCIICLLAFAANLALLADDAKFEVKVAVQSTKLTLPLRTELENKAKTEALKKYLLRLDSNLGQDLVRKACAEVDTFVEDIERQTDKWSKITSDIGQLEGSYIVELKLEKINQWLKDQGVRTQGEIELVIMEAPPSIGAIKLIEQAGTGIGAPKEFLQNYTSLQRRVSDCLIKKVDEFGFDVNLLADNDLYEEYKNKDNELVGVFYDPETNNFAINQDLLKAVQSNNPDTLVLYYRLETIEFVPDTKEVRVTVALSIKNLDTNVTKAFGTETFALVSQATTTSMLVDDIGFTAEKAILKLMNAEGAGSRLNRLAIEFKNVANAPTGPIKVVINATVIDAKIRKRVMYQLRKQLVEGGVTDASTIKSTNTSMTFEAKPDFSDPEALYFENISPIFEKLGVDLDDDKIFYGKGSITIKP
jgi:hypothetical protein